MMKRSIAFLLAVLALSTAATAQLTAARAFIDAPAKRFPLIQKMKRMDMVDYKNSGVDKPSDNLLGGKSKILYLAPDKIVVEECEAGVTVTSVSLDRFGKNDTVLIVTTDVATPAPDGTVTFYDSDWKPLGGRRFTPPSLDDWIRPGSRVPRSDIENAVPFVMASYDYNPQTHLLTVTQTLKQYLPGADYGKIASEMLDSLTYRWDGKKMVKIKPSR